jgi:hypothetical protein
MADLPDLAHLIDAVTAEAVTEDPVEQLARAARVRDELDELAEALLDHFVEQARDAGCSWSQIGSALGVSKQAAQQRHSAPRSVARRLLARLSEHPRLGRGRFLGRFTDRARAVVVLAQEEARSFNHNYLGTEHILLGLLREDEGVAAKALASMGVSLGSVRDQVAEIIGEGPTPPAGRIPFTPRAKKALELALREARALDHSYIGTEHILLGLLRGGDGVAVQILKTLGVDHDRSRDVVLRLLEDAA